MNEDMNLINNATVIEFEDNLYLFVDGHDSILNWEGASDEFITVFLYSTCSDLEERAEELAEEFMEGTLFAKAEKLLEDPLRPGQDLRDYKILCFNGQPEYIICVDGRYTDHYCHVVYDPQWNKQDVIIGQSSNSANYQKPDTLEEMLEIARTLSKDFPAVRIDLYDIGGQILFGEMTYFPWSGYMHFQPDEFDFVLGEKFTLQKN
jgi:hypothetical protein